MSTLTAPTGCDSRCRSGHQIDSRLQHHSRYATSDSQIQRHLFANPTGVTDLSLIEVFTKKGLRAICSESFVFLGENRFEWLSKKLLR